MSEHPRPAAVRLAAAIHLLIALAFMTVPVLGIVYGDDVQAAAEADAVRQGLPASVLADNDLSFRESGVAVAVPVLIAVAIASLGGWIRTGSKAARNTALIVMPLVILLNVAVMLSNAGAVAGLRAVFAASGDESLRRLDAQALYDAAITAYPDWLPWLTGIRNAVVFGGAVLVMVLLGTSRSRAFFRPSPPAAG